MLIGLKDVTYRIGTTVLLDKAEFSLEDKERVALVGRNGTGKSTLFRILTGAVKPEDGQVVKKEGLSISSLQQAVPAAESLTVQEVVAKGLGQGGQAAIDFQLLSIKDALNPEEQTRLDHAQNYLNEHHGWHLQSQIDQVISRFKLSADTPFASLSGGMKRKVLLAQALVSNPDILLLDEPTNHLDIPSIELLEDQVRQFNGAVILVSHDRAFMRSLATRVCDLDRGLLKSWSGGYEGYLKGKAEFLAAEEKQNALFDKRLAQEEVWIRKGIEARRTRNEGRVRALKEMRRQFAERRNLVGKAKVEVQEADRSGKIVAEIDEVSLSLNGYPILKSFSNAIMRGEKIGVLGPNGIGKTTALKVLLGELKPDSGHIKLGTKLEIAYFDQLRSGFNENETAVDVIGGGKEYLTQGGQSKHVMGYLQDFLFSPDRARQPVRSLSGGERARLLLAQLFAKPSNVLVLDEPTNDLDIETLELLEERLMSYEGTVLLVSHDREFIDQIVTRCWVFEGDGVIGDYIGGYEDWLRQRTCDPWQQTESTRRPSNNENKPNQTSQPKIEKPKKLSYKDARELEALPEIIEKLEKQQQEFLELVGDPTFYSKPAEKITEVQQQMADLEQKLEKAYARWEELDG